MNAYIIWDPVDSTFWDGDAWRMQSEYAETYPSAEEAMQVIEGDLDPDDLLRDRLVVCRAWRQKTFDDVMAEARSRPPGSQRGPQCWGCANRIGGVHLGPDSGWRGMGRRYR